MKLIDKAKQSVWIISTVISIVVGSIGYAVAIDTYYKNVFVQKIQHQFAMQTSTKDQLDARIEMKRIQLNNLRKWKRKGEDVDDEIRDTESDIRRLKDMREKLRTNQ